jgi:hypothetical protein
VEINSGGVMNLRKSLVAGVLAASLALPSGANAGMSSYSEKGANASIVLMLLGLVVVGILGGYGPGVGGTTSSKSESGTGTGKVLQEF